MAMIIFFHLECVVKNSCFSFGNEPSIGKKKCHAGLFWDLELNRWKKRTSMDCTFLILISIFYLINYFQCKILVLCEYFFFRLVKKRLDASNGHRFSSFDSSTSSNIMDMAPTTSYGMLYISVPIFLLWQGN